MTPEALRDLTQKALEDLKGIDILTLDVCSLTDLTDYMLICTGRSSRHVKALAENIVLFAKERKIPSIRMEGDQENEWVIVDLGDVVAHIMLANVRSFYQLEELWQPIETLRSRSS